MAKFSAGQMVVCTDAAGTDGKLSCGESYQVTRSGSYSLIEVDFTGYFHEGRFTLLPQTLKKDIAKENPMKSLKIIADRIPHIHAELIKAWADGAEIEQYSNSYGTWVVSEQPTWSVATSYRVKPTPTYPKTTMHNKDIIEIYNNSTEHGYAIADIANEAIKHFIVNGDMDKYIESIK